MRRRWLRATLLAAALLATGCAEDLAPNGDGAFIRGRVQEVFTEAAAVNLGVGLEYSMVSGKPRPRAEINLAPAQVTLSPPVPNPAVDTTLLRVQVSEAVPSHRLVVESASGQRPGVLAEWKSLGIGANQIHWDLRDKFTGEFLPNGLYFVRFLDKDLNVLSETRLFINRDARSAAVLQAFSTFTDANGDYVLEDVAVGETFTHTSTSGQVLGTQKPRNEVLLFHDDFEYVYEELSVFISPNQGVRFDFTVEPVAAAPESIQEEMHP